MVDPRQGREPKGWKWTRCVRSLALWNVLTFSRRYLILEKDQLKSMLDSIRLISEKKKHKTICQPSDVRKRLEQVFPRIVMIVTKRFQNGRTVQRLSLSIAPFTNPSRLRRCSPSARRDETATRQFSVEPAFAAHRLRHHDHVGTKITTRRIASVISPSRLEGNLPAALSARIGSESTTTAKI
jgi:hypothetical protein